MTMEGRKRICIERNLYSQEQLHKILEYEKPHTNALQRLTEIEFDKCLYKVLPVVRWLPRYNVKENLVGDLIAGVTVAVMHIPQGMAYAILGNVPPICGLYMAFFPVLIYVLFGTSRHVSMGSFAIVCLMTGKVVSQYSDTDRGVGGKNYIENSTLQSSAELFLEQSYSYTPIEVAVAVTFLTGVIQVIMNILQLGIISTLLSDTLVNGFISGAVIHVMTSQVKDLFGLSIKNSNGMFSVVNTWSSIIMNVEKFNGLAVAISTVTILMMLINNEFIKDRLRKKTAIPVPIELIAVVAGTFLSKYMQFSENYGVRTVGNIPVGIPEFAAPRFELLNDVGLDSLTIAIVSYTITFSMALIFAQQDNYEVDANQEFLALGLGNIFGSFFSCLPVSASLSRSGIQKTVGGNTQLASVVSSGLLLIVLLWIGPFFEDLPKCVLASIIVVSLKGMLMEVTKFVRFWHLSRYDGLIWLATFFSVVILNIDIGLFVGVLLSLIVIFMMSLKPYVCLLGAVPNTDLYLDINRYRRAIEIPGIKIVHFCGGLNFATSSEFKNDVYKITKLNPQKELVKRLKYEKSKLEEKTKPYITEIPSKSISFPGITHLIVDFSALSYIDPSGVTAAFAIIEEYEKIDVMCLLAGLSGPNYEKFTKCACFDKKEHILRIFPTIHDAVQSLKY